MVSEFFTGIRFLGRGFGYWKRRPGLMALGLVPGLIALALLAAVIVPVLLNLGGITAWATPFAGGWDPFWRSALRAALGAVVAIAVLVLASVTFTALTLLIGDPFYQRIWRAIETELGGDVPEGDGGFLVALRAALGAVVAVAVLVLASVTFTALTLLIGDPFYQRIWRAIETELGGDVPEGDGGFLVALGESIRLIALGALVALLALVVGFIPLIGAPLAAVTSVLLTGRLLARELTGRALNARDIPSFERSRLFAARRSRLLGFGAATQLCFMVPLGAAFIMPTAVAGATLLARDLLAQPTGAARA